MATALDVIRRAMRIIGALEDGEVPTASQAADGLEALRAMLGDWEARGLRLGAVVDMTIGTATTIPVPITHLQAMAFNLAVVIAPEYGRAEALAAVLPQAERAFTALRAQYAKVPVIGADPAVVWQRGILGNAGFGFVNTGDDDGAIYSDTGALFP
jgi:hypothetical protein